MKCNLLKYTKQLCSVVLLCLTVTSVSPLTAATVLATGTTTENTSDSGLSVSNTDTSAADSSGNTTDTGAALPDPGPIDTSLWPSGGPDVNAKSAIVMDADTGLILYEKDAHAKRYPASITKIMTTLLALEQGKLTDMVYTSYKAIWDVQRDSSRIGFDVDEGTTMEEMLYAIMLESDNNLAYAVAEHIGGTMEDFVDMMNTRAAELGCLGTHFANPHGLHNDEHYTTAYDMALISKQALTSEKFREITKTRTHTVPATNKNVARPIKNHHRFILKTLNYDGAIGGKTGYTDVARTTLVTFAERNGLTLICVVMKCDTGDISYADTTKLLDYAFNNYSAYKIDAKTGDTLELPPSLVLAGSNVENESFSPLRISKATVTLPNSAKFEDAKRSILYYPVTKLKRGDNVIGKVYYTYGGKYVGSADIIFSNVKMPSLVKGSLASSLKQQLSPTPTPMLTYEEDADLRPVIIGITVGLVVLFIGLYIIFVEIPHRRRRRAYMMRRRQRMNLYRNDSDFDDL